jgi:hypothetical protein
MRTEESPVEWIAPFDRVDSETDSDDRRKMAAANVEDFRPVIEDWIDNPDNEPLSREKYDQIKRSSLGLGKPLKENPEEAEKTNRSIRRASAAAIGQFASDHGAVLVEHGDDPDHAVLCGVFAQNGYVPVVLCIDYNGLPTSDQEYEPWVHLGSVGKSLDDASRSLSGRRIICDGGQPVRKPAKQTLNPREIPDRLSSRAQWICYRIKQRDDKPTKIPVNPHNGGFASSTDPETWSRLHEAQQYHNLRSTNTDGIGFVFTEDETFVGVDLDDCRDPGTGELTEWAEGIVTRLNSYAETSPSGTGVHIILRGSLPDNGNRHGNVEMYESGRFFTVTGNVLSLGGKQYDTLQSNPGELERVHHEFVGQYNSRENGDDSRDTEEIAKTFGGDGSDATGESSLGYALSEWRRVDPQLHELLQTANPGGVYESTSEADLACVIRLLHLEYDDGQIARILRHYRGREKVRERDDYIALTIRAGRNALSGTATEPEIEPGRGESDSLCHWKIRHFAVVHALVEPDGFKRQGSEEEGYYPGFDRTTWNLTIKALDDAEVDHGRSVHRDNEWEAKAAQDRHDAGQGVSGGGGEGQ